MTSSNEYEPNIVDLIRPAWQSKGACNGMTVPPLESASDEEKKSYEEVKDLFFPATENGKGETQIEKALQFCGNCVVKDECLEFALSLKEEIHGIWGGKLQTELRALRKRNRRSNKEAS